MAFSKLQLRSALKLDSLDEQAGHMLSLGDCNFELRDLPGRRLRRWPRRATLDDITCDPAREIWPVLQPQRSLWDD